MLEYSVIGRKGPNIQHKPKVGIQVSTRNGDLKMKPQLITLSGDGMVNLNKIGISFKSSGHDQWCSYLTDDQLALLLSVNDCTIVDGHIVDQSTDFQDTMWGEVS
jgi:hypothetical protein